MTAEKAIAYWLLVLIASGFMFSITFRIFPQTAWRVERSPITGQCYEVNVYWNILSYGLTMSPVDDEFCQKAGK